jgi:hypothetical protein
VDGDEFDLGLHASQGRGHRVVPLLAPLDQLDAQQCDVGSHLRLERLAVLGSNHQQRLPHIAAARELLGRMQPDRLPVQRDEGFFVVLIAIAAALASGGQDDGKRGHGGEVLASDSRE